MANTAARNQVFSDLAAQRAACDYAARPALDGAARAEQLLYLLEVAKQDGNLNRARAYAMELKPIMHLLPEGV